MTKSVEEIEPAEASGTQQIGVEEDISFAAQQQFQLEGSTLLRAE